MNSAQAVFFWTFRRKWKGFSIFIAATAVMIFAMIGFYPDFAELRGNAIAKALEGDIEVSLTQTSKAGDDYVLHWSKYAEADGYVVVESDTEIPLSLIAGVGLSDVDLRLLDTFLSRVGTLLPGDARISIHTFNATTTAANLTDLDGKYGKENTLIYFGVLAFRGEVSNANIQGASQTVNTGNMVASGAYDKIMENPVIKAFAGDIGSEMYTIKGFLGMELFSSLTIYIVIYFIIQYAGAFSSEVEDKTIDIILSTPMSRRRFFISRYLSWVAMNLVMIVSWIIFIYAGVLVLESVFGFGEAGVSLGEIALAMILFLPFLLSAQGFCMLTSVMTNSSKKAYGISFGIYFGMYFLHILSQLGERLYFIKYFTIFHYWNYKGIFVDGVVLWEHIAVLIILSAVLFIAGAVVFERKDL
ncbi:ABC transporter permease subunit [Candidatus Poribacteria bacterium]